MLRQALLLAGCLILTSCTRPEPPHWAEGAAPLALVRAAWQRADDEPVTLDEQGRVFEDGELVYVIDRVGRVIDAEGEPVAILFPAGELFGPSSLYLGRIGVANAAPPDSNQAWVAVMPDGTVTQFRTDGERVPDGRWRGCEGAAHRTCTLVTHLMLVRHYRTGSPQVTVGVGLWAPL